MSTEVSTEVKKDNVFLHNLASLSEPENFQKFVLGYKKSGQPRALYDVYKDQTEPKKKKKGKKKSKNPSSYSLYLTAKKHKKKKKHKKHWHI